MAADHFWSTIGSTFCIGIILDLLSVNMFVCESSLRRHILI